VVLEYLAEGGMGAIYLGKKMGAGGFEKQVVLKQLLPEFTRQPEFIDLFLREARLSATLDHANIIHTIDLVTAGEDYFIVMEYLDGADLRTLLRRCKRKRRRLSPAAGIYVARELLSALAYAHNKVGPDGVPLRLIHRDISPSNILISGSGEVKLTDFGIAKASTHNSVFYRVKGKVGYMSPEQAKSEHLDARSDLYSLAVCLFEVITGERLFVNAGLNTSAEEMYAQPVPLISHKVPGLPPELDKVMLKALSRDPDHRYQTAGEFQEALLRCAHRHGIMMSAPDLSEHLRHACGDPRTWRDDLGEHSGVGTELYDLEEGTDQIDPDELLGGGSGMVPQTDAELNLAVDANGALVPDDDARRRRARTSITKLTELRGMELTSMINLGGAPEHAGARPLIDFDDLAQSPMLPSNTPALLGGPLPGEADGYAPGPGFAPGPPGYGGGAPAPGMGQGMGMGPPMGHGPPVGHGPGLDYRPGPAPYAYQPPTGGQPTSLSELDPLEHTGIVVDGNDPIIQQAGVPRGMPGPGSGPMQGPGFIESGRVFAASPAGPPGAAGSGFRPGYSPMPPPRGAVGSPGPGWAPAAAARRPWLVLVLILLVGVGTAAAIGLSGPTVEAGAAPRPLAPTESAKPAP
jgi:serine/threonine protein kinase